MVSESTESPPQILRATRADVNRDVGEVTSPPRKVTLDPEQRPVTGLQKAPLKAEPAWWLAHLRGCCFVPCSRRPDGLLYESALHERDGRCNPYAKLWSL